MISVVNQITVKGLGTVINESSFLIKYSVSLNNMCLIMADGKSVVVEVQSQTDNQNSSIIRFTENLHCKGVYFVIIKMFYGIPLLVCIYIYMH